MSNVPANPGWYAFSGGQWILIPSPTPQAIPAVAMNYGDLSVKRDYESAVTTLMTGNYHPPQAHENLPEGIKFVGYWGKDIWITDAVKKHLERWADEANELYKKLQCGPVQAALPPMNCKRCNFRNEYVGHEHLVDGEYICRGCR